MLTVHMPDGHDAKYKKRRQQALGYLAAGVLIIASTFLASGTAWWFLPLTLEAWWLWAVISLDREKK